MARKISLEFKNSKRPYWKHVLNDWIKKGKKKSGHDEMRALDSQRENQGGTDNYRFLLQTTRPFSRLAFLCAKQKITKIPQTEVCIRQQSLTLTKCVHCPRPCPNHLTSNTSFNPTATLETSIMMLSIVQMRHREVK